MSKPNFLTMTKSELKRYLLEHRNDTEAFHALMDKINAEPNQKFYTIDEADVLENLIEAKRHSQDNQ
ncbi:MAG: hypothetical protein SAK29_42140 [Scytonema sp. PMC 1069.18]|nr:hypothetical protein [Scytonema sp. PMC 1069.18]MEC4880778.1 hypothetical protein [Scytonema sp. PMC 1070.18]